MKSISAFVGHSFTEDDAAVVNSVLNYLSRVTELNPSFSWTHAKHPEPNGTTLSESCFQTTR